MPIPKGSLEWAEFVVLNIDGEERLASLKLSQFEFIAEHKDENYVHVNMKSGKSHILKISYKKLQKIIQQNPQDIEIG